MERRRRNFNNGPHSAGLLFKIINKYSPFTTVYKFVECAYSFEPFGTEAEAIAAERREIKKYVMRFGEAPPLNAAIPGRDDDDDWGDVLKLLCQS